MLIGENYPKIEFELFGLDLLEPNLFITDSIIAFVALYLAFRVSKLKSKHSFNKYWSYFFLFIAITTFLGGLGHLIYNYTHIYGKIPSWFFAIVASYNLERAILTIESNEDRRVLYIKLVKYKFALALSVWLILLFFLDLSDDVNEKIPFIPVAANSGIGAIFIGIILCFKFAKSVDRNFNYIAYGTLIMVPSVFFMVLKINPSPWFTREDIGHTLMLTTYIITFIGIRKLNQSFLKD